MQLILLLIAILAIVSGETVTSGRTVKITKITRRELTNEELQQVFPPRITVNANDATYITVIDGAYKREHILEKTNEEGGWMELHIGSAKYFILAELETEITPEFARRSRQVCKTLRVKDWYGNAGTGGCSSQTFHDSASETSETISEITIRMR